MVTMIKPAGMMLQPDRFNPGLLDSISQDRSILVEDDSSGLILQKPHYAELISPGSGVGGRFDQEVVGIYVIGFAQLTVPQTPSDWKQSMVKRQSDIDRMLTFYERRDLVERAIAMLQFLIQRYGFATVQAIPADLLGLLTGTNEIVITLAWETILEGLESETPLSAGFVRRSPSGLEIQLQDIRFDSSTIQHDTVTDVLRDAVEQQPYRASPRHKYKQHTLASGIFLAVLGVSAGFWLYLRDGYTTAERVPSSDRIAQQRILPVSTQRLTASDYYSVERYYVGEIQAKRVGEIGFEVAGTLVDFPLREGDIVQSGNILARLDSRSSLLQRQQLLAQRAKAQATLQKLKAGPRSQDIEAMRASVRELEQQVQLAQNQSTRGKKLYDQGAISRETYEERHFNERTLRMRLLQSQKRLEALEAGTRTEQILSQEAELSEIDARLRALAVEQSKTTLKAPFSGYVAKKMVSEGAALSGGQAILELVESGVMEARVGVPISVADQIKPGDTMPIKVGNSAYSAKVRTLLPDVDEHSQTATVALDFQPDSFLPLGQAATITLKTSVSEPGFWLPTTALIASDRGLWSAYILTPIGSKSTSTHSTSPRAQHSRSTATTPAASDSLFAVAKREVEVLYTQGDRVYVRGMLVSGEHVIDQGVQRIATGQLVRIAENI